MNAENFTQIKTAAITELAVGIETEQYSAKFKKGAPLYQMAEQCLKDIVGQSAAEDWEEEVPGSIYNYTLKGTPLYNTIDEDAAVLKEMGVSVLKIMVTAGVGFLFSAKLRTVFRVVFVCGTRREDEAPDEEDEEDEDEDEDEGVVLVKQLIEELKRNPALVKEFRKLLGPVLAKVEK
jgi:hypothetical protein